MSHWVVRAARSTALGVLAEIFARCGNTVFFILLIWYLGLEEAGVYTLGFTFANFLIHFSLGGLDQLLNREVVRSPDNRAVILGNFLLARLISSLLCYAALAVWLSGPHGYTTRVNAIVLLLSATLIPDSLVVLCQAYMIASERVGYITVLGAITGGFKLLVGGVMLLVGGDAFTVGWVVLAASVLSLGLYLYLICTRFESPKFHLQRSFWIEQGREQWPIYLVSIIATVEGSLDTILLSRDNNTLGVGTYGAASAILSTLLIVPQTYRQMIVPIMTKWVKTFPGRTFEIYTQSARAFIITALPICIALTMYASNLLPLVYRQQSYAAVPVLQILIWSFLFTSLNIPNGRLMLVFGRQTAAVPILLISMVLNVSLNLLLQPSLGAEGAALARLASTSLTFLLSLLYVQRYIYRWNVWRIAIAPLGSLVTMSITLLVLESLGIYWLVALLFGVFVYIATLSALGGIHEQEWIVITSLIRRRATQIRVVVRGLL